MRNSRVLRAAVLLSLVLGLASCGASDEPIDDMAVVSEAIVNGQVPGQALTTSYGLVAIYHQRTNGTWYPRPCSGYILKYSSGIAWVLTARHCTTGDGSALGTVLHPSKFRLTPTASPGPTSGVVLDNLATPNTVIGMSQGLVAVAAKDLALMAVSGVNWSANVAQRHGFFVRNPASLEGKLITAFGYGSNIDPCTSSNTEGVGIARFANFTVAFGEVLSTGGAWYRHGNNSALEQALTCGDSGGPDFSWPGGEENEWTTLVGIHSQSVPYVTAPTAATSKWVQDTIGGLYVSSHWERTRNLGRGSSTALALYASTNAMVDTFKYDASTKYFTIGSGECISRSLELVSCSNTNTNKWNITATQEIKSAQDSLCLTKVGSSTLAVQACNNGTAQMWSFHAQR